MTFRPAACATPALAGVVVSAVLLSACASTPQTAALRATPTPLLLAAPRLLEQVPFIAQDEFQCGPAALAMVLRADGAAVDAESLKAQLYLPARAGSLQPELLATARRHGRLAAELPPQLDAVLTEVARGTPVIVLQNLSLPLFPVWHYAVVIGFDLQRGELTLHSGLTERQTLPLNVFERTWARSGHWAMVATPPERLPVSATPEQLLAAAAALERVDPSAARATYAALTVRAPSLANAWFGLGNSAFAAKDLQAAAAAFEQTVTLAPQHADAWNNLAHTRLVLRRLVAAREAAHRAIALGGARSELYRITLAEIERAINAAARGGV